MDEFELPYNPFPIGTWEDEFYESYWGHRYRTRIRIEPPLLPSISDELAKEAQALREDFDKFIRKAILRNRFGSKE